MYKTITIKAGSGGWGGPLTIVPTEKCNKILGILKIIRSATYHWQVTAFNIDVFIYIMGCRRFLCWMHSEI